MVGKNRLRLAPENSRLNSRAAKHRNGEAAVRHSDVTTSALQLQAAVGNRAIQRLIQREAEEEHGSPDLFNVPGVTLPAPGGGRSLPDDLRSVMEQSFEQSFQDVRIHEDNSPDSVGALAYTQGNHIHFSPGQYRPKSESGRAIVGHELTHVVQQRAGRVASPQGSGAPVNADPSLEDEAERLGKASAQGESVSGPGISGAASSVQRAVKPVQRKPGDPPGGGRRGSQIDPSAFKKLMAFWSSGNAGNATQIEVAEAAPDVAAFIANPPMPDSEAPTAEEQTGLDSAIGAAETDPEGVMDKAGISPAELQAAETEQAEVLADEHEAYAPSGKAEAGSNPSSSVPGAAKKLSDADPETKLQAAGDLETIKGMAAALVKEMQKLSSTASAQAPSAGTATTGAPGGGPPGGGGSFTTQEVEGVVKAEGEERREEQIETGLEQLGIVGASAEGYKELGSGGSWTNDVAGGVAGAGALVGSAATIASALVSIKDGYETLNDDSLDMQLRVDAVGQITEALSSLGGVGASVTEMIGAWSGRAKAFTDAASNWGAAFGIVTGGVTMARAGVSGGLAHHRIKKLKAIKERRGQDGGEHSEKIAEAAGEAIDTNKARRTNAIIDFGQGGVTLAAGILALAGAGPVGWGIAAGVGLVSAIWAGYKWWKRKHQDPEIRKAELLKQLQVVKLIEKGILITDAEVAATPGMGQVRDDYRQIALKLGASKKKVIPDPKKKKFSPISAANLAKLMSRH